MISQTVLHFFLLAENSLHAAGFFPEVDNFCFGFFLQKHLIKFNYVTNILRKKNKKEESRLLSNMLKNFISTVL